MRRRRRISWGSCCLITVPSYTQSSSFRLNSSLLNDFTDGSNIRDEFIYFRKPPGSRILHSHRQESFIECKLIYKFKCTGRIYNNIYIAYISHDQLAFAFTVYWPNVNKLRMPLQVECIPGLFKIRITQYRSTKASPLHYRLIKCLVYRHSFWCLVKQNFSLSTQEIQNPLMETNYLQKSSGISDIN